MYSFSRDLKTIVLVGVPLSLVGALVYLKTVDLIFYGLIRWLDQIVVALR